MHTNSFCSSIHPYHWQLALTKPGVVINLAGNKGKMPAGIGKELEDGDDFVLAHSHSHEKHTWHSTTSLIGYSLPAGNWKVKSKEKRQGDKENCQTERHKNGRRSQGTSSVFLP